MNESKVNRNRSTNDARWMPAVGRERPTGLLPPANIVLQPDQVSWISLQTPTHPTGSGREWHAKSLYPWFGLILYKLNNMYSDNTVHGLMWGYVLAGSSNFH